MTSPNKVTRETNELTFDNFLNTQRYISIPLFQRRYVWKKRNFDQLIEDISAIEDAQDAARFLGTVVAVARDTGFDNPYEELEIVDGQQRTISIYLFLCALAEVACQRKLFKVAAKIVARYLILKDKDLEVTTTVHTSLEDRHEFRQILQYLRDYSELSEELHPFAIRPPAIMGVEPPESRQELLSQYFRIRKYLLSCVSEYDDAQVSKFVSASVDVITKHLTFVSLKLRDPASAPLIFQSLNEKGVKTTIGDLVRNEIFSKVYNDPALAKSVFMNEWQPFIHKFKGNFDDYLFPFCLTYDHKIVKTECFQELRKIWIGINDPAEIIKDLEQYSDTFIALEENVQGVFDAEIFEQFSKYHWANIPSSVYPFIFQAVSYYESGKCSKNDLIQVLQVVESFLVRRAICGIEPTGLHAVFKTLWTDLDCEVDAIKTASKLKSITTQEWPDDNELIQKATSRPLYTSRICKFILMELEQAEKADVTEPDFQIEHVMPRTLNEKWQDEGITPDIHEKLRDTIGNLITISKQLNPKVGQSLFPIKKREYAKKSKYALPRMVASKYSTWTPAVIETRSAEIAKWMVKRWPKS